MGLKPIEANPGHYAIDFTERQRLIVSLAFSEEVCLQAGERLEQAEPGDVVVFDDIPDIELELALDQTELTLSADEVERVRSVLLLYGERTSDVIGEKLSALEKHEYDQADGIAERILLGRAAKRLAQDLASNNTTAGLITRAKKHNRKGDRKRASKALKQLLPSDSL